ncbi:NlpC/P60 family protein [Sinomonas sp. ASV322]|uniref:NlpC/P60 family protein n=1 Tax=Sinomonas sp. ASV322 TaxID=3041920 RepID=UPI0027DCC240|nr:NlpC/P60 family protein [Sinomonas sp. ASV322]MDQ4503176.1 NlpC/P60 family protein [Sinomonas sp. ASV322]
MSTRAGIARHRAENTSSIAVIAKAVTENASGMGRQAAVLAAASGLVLTSGVAANAAEIPTQRDASAPTALEVQTAVETNVAADAGAQVSFERPAVQSEAAPAPVQTVSNTVRTASSNTALAASAPAAAKPVASSGMGAAIAAAAYAQLGVHQDCTALVTNALAAVGIYYHGWPAGYLSLGRQVSAAEAQPGDLAYYQNGGMGMAHIAVYVGNGMAVHGGWNGSNTVLYSVNVGSGPVFIRVGG